MLPKRHPSGAVRGIVLVRAAALALLVTALVVAPAAAATYQGSCVKHKGVTGFSLTLEDCVPASVHGVVAKVLCSAQQEC